MPEDDTTQQKAESFLVATKSFVEESGEEKYLWKREGAPEPSYIGVIHLWKPGQIAPQEQSGKVGETPEEAMENQPPGVLETQSPDPGQVEQIIAEEVEVPVTGAETGQEEETVEEAEAPALEGGGDPGLPAAAAEAWEELFAQAVSLHRLGAEGDREAVVKAHHLLEKVRQLAPENNLVEAYYGSATALLGRDSSNPRERFQKALKGLKILDSAISREPESTDIRIQRAYVCYHLPERFFLRTYTAVDDFRYLVSRYEEDPVVFSKDLYCQILFDLGVSLKRLKRDSEAKAVWQKLLLVTNQPKYLDLLRQEGFQAGGRATAGGDWKNIGAGAGTAEYKGVAGEGVKWYRQALEGDKKSLTKAFGFFEQASRKNPEVPLAKAYYADCMTMVGRESSDLKEMFASSYKAIKAMDAAVNCSPEDIEVRMIRAYHSFRLPEALFRRTATAIADFEYLARRYESDPSVFPAEKYRKILSDLVEAYRRLGLDEESRPVRDKLLSLNPGPGHEAGIEGDAGPDPVMAANLTPGNREELLQEGFRLYDLALAGSRPAAGAALELWQKASEEAPDDTVAQAYLGGCLVLAGRDANEPRLFFGQTIKGLKMIDSAADLDQVNPRIRILRAFLVNSLPEAFFRKNDQVIQDFQYLKNTYEQDNTVFAEEVYQRILYDLGTAYQRDGDLEKAKEVWRELLQVSSDPKYKDLLSNRVEG